MLPLFQNISFYSGPSSENPHKGAYKWQALQQDAAGNTEETDRTLTAKQKHGWDRSNLERAKALEKKKQQHTQPKQKPQTIKIVPEHTAPAVSITWFSLSSSQS